MRRITIEEVHPLEVRITIEENGETVVSGKMRNYLSSLTAETRDLTAVDDRWRHLEHTGTYDIRIEGTFDRDNVD